MKHIYVSGFFVNFLVIFEYVWGYVKLMESGKF